jgi:hypothetical protein
MFVLLVGNRPRRHGRGRALVGRGVDKYKCGGAGVSDVVDRNVWGCGSMAPAVGVAWVT